MSRLSFRATALAAATGLVALIGCDSGGPTDDFYELRQGWIVDFGRPATVSINGTTVSSLNEGMLPVTAEVRAGVPFNVTSFPLSAPGCNHPAPSIITRSELTATVAVYDSAFARTCNYILTGIPRTDRLVFESPGEATVVIRGGAYNVQGQPRPLPEVDLPFTVVVTE